jgi:hypothetical protein
VCCKDNRYSPNSPMVTCSNSRVPRVRCTYCGGARLLLHIQNTFKVFCHHQFVNHYHISPLCSSLDKLGRHVCTLFDPRPTIIDSYSARIHTAIILLLFDRLLHALNKCLDSIAAAKGHATPSHVSSVFGINLECLADVRKATIP